MCSTEARQEWSHLRSPLQQPLEGWALAHQRPGGSAAELVAAQAVLLAGAAARAACHPVGAALMSWAADRTGDALVPASALQVWLTGAGPSCCGAPLERCPWR